MAGDTCSKRIVRTLRTNFSRKYFTDVRRFTIIMRQWLHENMIVDREVHGREKTLAEIQRGGTEKKGAFKDRDLSIPVELSKKIDVIFNMKSAKAGQFDVPPEFMKKVTRTIE